MDNVIDAFLKESFINTIFTFICLAEQLNNQVFSCSSDEGDQSTDESDPDSFSFPSLSERLSKKCQSLSICTTSSRIKRNNIGAKDVFGNATGDNYGHCFREGRITTGMKVALCTEKRTENILNKQRKETIDLLSYDVVEGNVGESNAAVVEFHFQSPNKQTQILFNNTDLSKVDNLDRVLPSDDPSNGELCTNVQGVKVAPCTSNELGQAGNTLKERCDLMSIPSDICSEPLSVVYVSEETNRPFDPSKEETIENEICEYPQKGMLSIADQMSTTSSAKAKLREKHIDGLAKIVTENLKTNKSSEHLCVSTSSLEQTERAATNSSTTAFTASSSPSPLFDDVFIESPLNDDDVFVVPSLRERLRQRLEERNTAGLDSTPLLVDLNEENQEFCNQVSDKYRSQLLTVQKCKSSSKEAKGKTEGKDINKQTGYSLISKDGKAVDKEIKIIGDEKELKKTNNILFQEDSAIVQKAQADRINLAREQKRVRKKTIPKSQRTSCIDSPQEAVAVGRKRGKSIAKNKK